MTWQPDSAVVLSLPQREDRRAYMNATVDRLGFPARIVDAVDGTTVTLPLGWRSSPGAYGNAMSHRAALTSATGSILVLEDDAHIPGDFRARLELVLTRADDWDVIMLGGEHVLPAAPHAPGVVRCGGTIRSIGYIMRGPAIPASVAAIDRARGHWDSEWIRVLQRYRTYAPDPFIIRPSGLGSDIPDSPAYR